MIAVDMGLTQVQYQRHLWILHATSRLKDEYESTERIKERLVNDDRTDIDEDFDIEKVEQLLGNFEEFGLVLQNPDGTWNIATPERV